MSKLKVIVNPIGPIDSDIFIIGEAPGKEEVKVGQPFVGLSGDILNTWLKELEIDRDKCYITNAIKHKPARKTAPSNKLIDESRSILLKELYKVQPKIIITLGAVALKSLLNNNNLSITEYALKPRMGSISEQIPDVVLLPLYHPAYCNRYPDKMAEQVEFIKTQGLTYVKNTLQQY